MAHRASRAAIIRYVPRRSDAVTTPSNNARMLYLNVEDDLGHEGSERHKQLNVSHEPLDGLLEELLLQTDRVVPYLRLGDLEHQTSVTFYTPCTVRYLSYQEKHKRMPRTQHCCCSRRRLSGSLLGGVIENTRKRKQRIRKQAEWYVTCVIHPAELGSLISCQSRRRAVRSTCSFIPRSGRHGAHFFSLEA